MKPTKANLNSINHCRLPLPSQASSLLALVIAVALASSVGAIHEGVFSAGLFDNGGGGLRVQVSQ